MRRGVATAASSGNSEATNRPAPGGRVTPTARRIGGCRPAERCAARALPPRRRRGSRRRRTARPPAAGFRRVSRPDPDRPGGSAAVGRWSGCAARRCHRGVGGELGGDEPPGPRRQGDPAGYRGPAPAARRIGERPDRIRPPLPGRRLRASADSGGPGAAPGSGVEAGGAVVGEERPLDIVEDLGGDEPPGPRRQGDPARPRGPTSTARRIGGRPAGGAVVRRGVVNAASSRISVATSRPTTSRPAPGGRVLLPGLEARPRPSPGR